MSFWDSSALLPRFADKRQAEQILRQLAAGWSEVQPVSLVRERAVRVLALHDLRAADALQLAAALVCAEERVRSCRSVRPP